MFRSRKAKIGWIVAAVVVIGGFVGGYFVLAESPHTNYEWNPISKKCRFDLKVSSENKKRIEEIVETVANTSYLSLLGKKSHLDKLGDLVDKDVPTLDFWGYIFSVPKLAKDMKKIQSESTKYNNFIENSRDGFLKAYHQNTCFFGQIKSFAKFLKVNPDQAEKIMKECLKNAKSDKRAFKPFIDYLISQKAK